MTHDTLRKPGLELELRKISSSWHNILVHGKYTSCLDCRAIHNHFCVQKTIFSLFQSLQSGIKLLRIAWNIQKAMFTNWWRPRQHTGLQRILAWLQRPPRFNSLRWSAKTIFSLFFENWKCEQKCSKHCNMDFSGQRTAYNTYTPKVYSYGNWLACHCSYNDRSFEPGRSYMRLFFDFCAPHNHLGVHKDESSLFHLLQSRLSRLCIAWYNGKPCSRLEQRAGKASTSAPFGLTSAPSQLQLFASKCKNNILIVFPEFETANGNVRPS